MNGERRVLVLDPANEMPRELSHPALQGWRFQYVASLPAAAHAAEHTPVGLVTFPPQDTLPIAPLECLLTTPGMEWIALIHPGTLDNPARASLILHAFCDHHTRPVDAHRLAVTLGHTWGRMMLGRAHQAPASPEGSFGLTGVSPPMRALYRAIDRAAQTTAPVLITGESGVGKELVARAIARHARHPNGPLIAINCAAIPATLLQAELFGYERGAFTGATTRRIGCIESANGGVLLLDEIATLPLGQQASLLRFLQEGDITRLGATKPIKVSARVIAATHVDLQAAVTQGQFRADLFYRLNVLHIPVPPLRDRGSDIVLLAKNLLEAARRRHPGRARALSRAAQDALAQHPWPGNVRELINRVSRALIMSESRLISAQDLGLDSPDGAPVEPLAHARHAFEKTTIEACLETNGHNIARSARTLGVSRATLYRWISRLGIASD